MLWDECVRSSWSKLSGVAPLHSWAKLNIVRRELMSTVFSSLGRSMRSARENDRSSSLPSMLLISCGILALQPWNWRVVPERALNTDTFSCQLDQGPERLAPIAFGRKSLWVSGQYCARFAWRYAVVANDAVGPETWRSWRGTGLL